jgi:hypothetical protein
MLEPQSCWKTSPPPRCPNPIIVEIYITQDDQMQSCIDHLEECRGLHEILHPVHKYECQLTTRHPVLEVVERLRAFMELVQPRKNEPWLCILKHRQ